ncbi:Histidine biosynthesis bifunctional protein hisB [Exophiala xenobiotica]|nr:Histidine biosynthesis bifunctional protein hisB [Exophiala xenobiotica]KAK5196268.1 Histidine biosynthesis bifunctional protein hisB [Exophiala xenobiotica]KAK5214312.1 Histidine biosynthesis bifunctional protein hisB [Exophiala xenobiotica]KAK5331253.1 Histidine biosynthesis bifunctional protein hisB [Exophiala xenobiotica]
MPKVHLLDYVAGNIRSLVNAIEKCGYEVEWIRSPEDVKTADKIILPGVGHFGHCLKSLSDAGYLPAIHDHIAADKPFFGICVGLQALFSGSEEAPSVPGLGLIPTSLRRFRASNADGSRKSVPCIGWNDANTFHHVDTLGGRATGDPDGLAMSSLYGLNPTSKYYYVHSYFAPYTSGHLESEGWTVATARYGDETYVGAIGRGNVFATQFHPEKSGAAGLRVIKAFLDGRMWTPALPNSVPGNILALSSNSSSGGSINGLTRRIIACLDVRTNDAGDLVVTKGDQYDVREKSGDGNDVRNLGKPVDMARKYYTQGADEVTFLNITSFRDCPITDLPMLEILRRTSETVFVPLTIGGGIRDMRDPATGKEVSALDVAKLYFASGADKVSIGSDAVLAAEEYWANGGQGSGKSGIETISGAYGAQAVVVSVDPKRVYVSGPSESASELQGKKHKVIKTADKDDQGREYVWFACTIKGGREVRDLDVVALVSACEAMGAGEILLNAIDRDGSNRGYDLELISLVKSVVNIPVIASSGAGRPAHFDEVFRQTDVDAALGAGMFHRGEYTVAQVKEHLGQAGLLVRPFEEFEP